MARKIKASGFDLNFETVSSAVVEEKSLEPECFGDYDSTVCVPMPDFLCGRDCASRCIEKVSTIIDGRKV